MGVYTQTTTFANGTTADGGQVNTEIVNLGQSVNNVTNAQIDSAAAIAISKTALGTYSDWTTWSPTWSFLAGTGTFTLTTVNWARYMRLGNTVYFDIDAYHTLATCDASTITMAFTMPVNTTASGHIFTALAKDPANDTQLMPAVGDHIHASAANKILVSKVFSGNTVSVNNQWTNGTTREVWVQGFYEVA